MKKWRDLSGLAVLGAFILVSHQNCAPASGGRSTSSSSDGSAVSVIDDVKSNEGVSFSVKELQLNSQLQTFSLQGDCSAEQNDAIIGWQVRKQDPTTGVADLTAGAVFASGSATCENGHFMVELSPTQGLVCGQNYVVTARLGLGDPGTSVISRACPSGS